MSTRRLRALGVVAATVLLTGGCAAGTHPGAAAVVGKTEISISDVDKTSRAVTTALGQNFNATATLNTLVRARYQIAATMSSGIVRKFVE